MFKHDYRFDAKKNALGGGYSYKVCERYLYQNEAKTKWFLGERPDQMAPPIPAVPMTAYVVDSAADPRDIVGTWSCYDELSGEYKPYRRLTAQEEKRRGKPFDRIRIVETSGVEVSSCESPAILDGSFLRQAHELFGRPVYEMENGGQYLYWTSATGKPINEDGFGSGTAMLNHELHKDEGFWCISDQLGALAKRASEGNWAYAGSSAATPDQIEGEWQTFRLVEGCFCIFRGPASQHDPTRHQRTGCFGICGCIKQIILIACPYFKIISAVLWFGVMAYGRG